MALTSNDIKLRQHRINWYLDELRSDKTHALRNLAVDVKDKKNPKTTLAIQTSVLAEALGRDLLVVQDIPVNLIDDVRKKWLKGAADRDRDDAASLGTLVHKHAERLAQGEVFGIPDEHLDHVRVWRAWVEYYGVEFVDTEFTVFNLALGYAGTGDFLARFRKRPDWGLVLGDYKTSKSGLWASVALQLTALRYAQFIGRCRTCPHMDNVHPIEDVYADYETLKQVKTLVGVQITAESFHTVPVNPSRMKDREFKDAFKGAIATAAWKSTGEKNALLPDAEQKVIVNATQD